MEFFKLEFLEKQGLIVSKEDVYLSNDKYRYRSRRHVFKGHIHMQMPGMVMCTILVQKIELEYNAVAMDGMIDGHTLINTVQ